MYGIRGTASLLINSYLSNRDRHVVCDEYNSNVLPVRVGVPQTSVLSTLPFNIFINVFFVDDAVFYAVSVNFHELVETIQ